VKHPIGLAVADRPQDDRLRLPGPGVHAGQCRQSLGARFPA
jgi:hypothetical protein